MERMHRTEHPWPNPGALHRASQPRRRMSSTARARAPSSGRWRAARCRNPARPSERRRNWRRPLPRRWRARAPARKRVTWPEVSSNSVVSKASSACGVGTRTRAPVEDFRPVAAVGFRPVLAVAHPLGTAGAFRPAQVRLAACRAAQMAWPCLAPEFKARRALASHAGAGGKFDPKSAASAGSARARQQ